MKHILFITIFCFMQLSVSGQFGYSKFYDLAHPGISFSNINMQNDTLLVFGSVFHDTIPNLQGLFFAKFDTIGNLLSYHTTYDSFGGHLTSLRHSTLHKLNDGSGYVIPAGKFTHATGMLCFLNIKGEFVKTIEYNDTSSQKDRYNVILENSSSLFVLGTKQRTDYQNDVFVMKTDKQGNKLWEKYYDSPGRQWLFASIYKENDNQYLIGAGTAKAHNPPFSQMNFQTVFIRIDSSGNKLWQWESPLGLLEIGPGSVQKNSAGNWIYVDGEIQIFANQGYVTKNTKIVIRDEDFNLVSEKIISLPLSEFNGLVEVQPTQDGNWIGVGSMSTPPLWTQPNALAGWMYRFDNNLDQVWNREDTVFYNLQTYTEHSLHGAVQLPSGSIIAAGQINVYYPSPAKSWGWIIKVSKDGCIDTLACSISAVEDWKDFKESNVSVFPNPTNGLLFFDDNEIQWDKIEIISTQGQVLRVLSKPSINELNLSDMKSGIYMIRFIHKNQSIVKRIFKE